MAVDRYKYFRIEARELVEQLGQGVLDLEKGAASIELVARLLRVAHTLKGAARVVKQTEIGELAHAIEDSLAPFRTGGGLVARDVVDALLAAVDRITVLVGELGPAREAPAAGGPALVADEPTRALRADVGELDALLEGIVEVSVQVGGLRNGLQVFQRARLLVASLSEQLRSQAAAALTAQGAGNVQSLAEELRSVLEAGGLELTTAVEQIDRELQQTREAAEQLRLLPASVMFTALERTARDTAQTLGKRVTFEARGGDVRLDAHVLATVHHALLQAVRNAVAHGLESEGERLRAGKAPGGTVSLEVRRRGGKIVFSCRDDGRGIDVEAVRRAIERKRGLPADSAELGADELLRLLMQSGISTAATVTAISGRGVGLDVIRDAVARLGGEVNVRTRPGDGTTIEITAPGSVGSLVALVVEACDQVVAIPLEAVHKTLRVAETDLARTADGATLIVERQSMPFTLLAPVLDCAPQATMPSSWSAVVLESGEHRVAIGVDRLRGVETVVVRPLPALTPADALVAGASLDAEGNPRLLLDAANLVSAVLQAAPARTVTERRKEPILVVDDSLTTRMLEQSILESAGYDADTAVSAEEGLAKAGRRRYALFLVDVEMPGMDGFEFIERVRADADLRDIPCILVTSRATAADRKRGQEVGARGYIVKGEFDQNRLLEQIGTLLRAP
jgi:two-component system, chemotaxis family, sensor kinase CheA